MWLSVRSVRIDCMRWLGEMKRTKTRCAARLAVPGMAANICIMHGAYGHAVSWGEADVRDKPLAGFQQWDPANGCERTVSLQHPAGVGFYHQPYLFAVP